jgi:hypothetical protein
MKRNEIDLLTCSSDVDLALAKTSKSIRYSRQETVSISDEYLQFECRSLRAALRDGTRSLDDERTSIDRSIRRLSLQQLKRNNGGATDLGFAALILAVVHLQIGDDSHATYNKPTTRCRPTPSLIICRRNCAKIYRNLREDRPAMHSRKQTNKQTEPTLTRRNTQQRERRTN